MCRARTCVHVRRTAHQEGHGEAATIARARGGGRRVHHRAQLPAAGAPDAERLHAMRNPASASAVLFDSELALGPHTAAPDGTQAAGQQRQARHAWGRAAGARALGVAAQQRGAARARQQRQRHQRFRQQRLRGRARRSLR